MISASRMTIANSDALPVPRDSRFRAISALELLLAAAIVLGHNVWKVVPNEVPILFLLGLVSYRIRNGGFAAIGFRRPASWAKIVGIAIAAAALRIALGDLVIEPLATRIWPPITGPEGFDSIAGDWKQALTWLGLVWTFAAFGEEIAYRGYILGRAAESFGGTNVAYALALIISSVLFGFGHFYKGPAESSILASRG
jgi:membrane protease YdiL (CAAX protease family)